jgi:ubiquinol-cytochrome c reductase cytochrome c subunit
VQNQPNASGSSLGNLGPVPEGLFVWIVGIGALIGCAVWLGAKAA